MTFGLPATFRGCFRLVGACGDDLGVRASTASATSGVLPLVIFRILVSVLDLVARIDALGAVATESKPVLKMVCCQRSSTGTHSSAARGIHGGLVITTAPVARRGPPSRWP